VRVPLFRWKRRPAPPAKVHPSAPQSPADMEAQFMREVEAEVARIMPEIEAEAARLHDEAVSDAERAWLAEPEEHDQDDVNVEAPYGVVYRSEYVPKENEARYLTRDANGLPELRLVDAGDRLVIWSPRDGGALINAKNPGIRHLGLYASYARGSNHYASAYRAADLSKGRWVDLKREADNRHDRNAVAMCAPGSRVPFAYVQRGRAPAVARRMDTGEDMAAVSMRGPGKGGDDDAAFVLIGSRADLTAMLDA
jgi:hypothetical protein